MCRRSHHCASNFSWKEITSSSDSDTKETKEHCMTTRNLRTRKFGSYCSCHGMETRLCDIITDENMTTKNVNEHIKKYTEK